VIKLVEPKIFLTKDDEKFVVLGMDKG